MKKGLIYVILLLFMYTYIYAPPLKFIPFGTDKIIFLFSVLYIAKLRKWQVLFYKFRIEYSFLLLLAFYSLTRGIFSNEFFFGKYDLLLSLEAITVPYALWIYTTVKSKYKCDVLIINCASIASLISLYLILNPELAYYFKTELLKYPDQIVDTFAYRGYGLSDGLTFSYPIVQGLCMGMIILSSMKNRIYYLFLIPMLISIFTNARSGMVPVFISIILLMISNPKYFFRISLIVVLVSSVSVELISAVLEDNEMLKTSTEWGLTSFDILGDLFKGKKTENMEILLGDMLVFPENLQNWIFGSGVYLFGKTGLNTDIGYLLRLNFGGIIYSLIYFLMLCYMFRRQYLENRTLALFMFASFVYCHFKSDFLIANPSSRFFFLIYVFSILDPNFLKSSKINSSE